MSAKVYFFDMDHTLIDNDCDVSWKEYTVLRGLAPASHVEKAAQFFDDYNHGCLDTAAFLRFQLTEFIGKTPDEMRPLIDGHFAEFVRHKVYHEGKELIAECRRLGIPTAILTSTNRFVARPVADFLGVDHLFGTDLELRNGRFTGEITGVYHAKQGKVAVAGEFCRRHGFTLSDFAYFGDSINDLDLLQEVGQPRAVNPSASLRQIAEANQWEILTFKEYCI